jgi:tRNA A37 threonylcarbamoyladenosine dehydratase
LATSGDRLLRQVRKKLLEDYGFSRDPAAKYRVPAVVSDEPQVFPWQDGACRPTPQPGENLKMDCASGFGAATMVTGAFGFAAAAEIVRRLTRPPQQTTG